MGLLREGFEKKGYLEWIEGRGWALTEAGRVYLKDYDARHPRLGVDALGGVVRAFEGLGVEAWADTKKVEVCLRLRGKVDVVRYINREVPSGALGGIVEDMRAELEQREASQTS